MRKPIPSSSSRRKFLRTGGFAAFALLPGWRRSEGEPTVTGSSVDTKHETTGTHDVTIEHILHRYGPELGPAPVSKSKPSAKRRRN